MLVVKNYQRGSCEKVRGSGEEIQEVTKFKYVGVLIYMEGRTGEELAHMVLEERKLYGTMSKSWKENMISRKVNRELYEKV